jgi:hypothetical protein
MVDTLTWRLMIKLMALINNEFDGLKRDVV